MPARAPDDAQGRPGSRSEGVTAAGDVRRRPSGVVLLAAALAAALVLVLQARLVGSAFLTPLHAGDGELPASLRVLAEGRGPLAAPDLPPATAGGFGGPPGSTGGSGAQPAVDGSGAQVALAEWANDVGPLVGVPPVALAAYGAAQLALSAAQPDCHLSWPTLAGIGSVESNHGRFAGATLGADGRSSPPIIGVPLDGGVGVARIADTDGGRLDGDPALDRAVGAMQFIPTTWARWGADGDADGRTDPFDIDDAALAAARYLCAAGGDLSTGGAWTRAVFSYNASDDYVISVRARADDYARRSQAATG